MKTLPKSNRILIVFLTLFGLVAHVDVFGQTDSYLGAGCGLAPDASGDCSFAAGDGADASGDGAVAVSAGDASGESSFAGSGGSASGNRSTALSGASASGSDSFAAAKADAQGSAASALGNRAWAKGDNSIAIGRDIEAASTANHNFVIGRGAQSFLVNDITNSLMVGFNSSESTMFIEGAPGTGDDYGQVGIGTTDPDGILHLYNSTTSQNTDLVLDKLTTQSARVVFHDAGTESANIRLDGGDDLVVEQDKSNEDIFFKVNDGGTDTEAMRIVGATTNVGIGTSSPDARLHVLGLDNMGANEILGQYGTFDADIDDNYLRIQNESGTNGEFGTMLKAKTSSHTDRPVLLIKALANIDSDGSTEPIMQFDSRTIEESPDTNSRPLFVWTENNDGASKMIMNEKGNLGIGVNSPTEILHVNGRGRSSSDTWTTISDQRVKENINQLEGAREILNALNPVTYSWISEYSDSHLSAPVNNWGFISQEVELVMPEMVSTVPEENVGDTANELILNDLKLLNLSPLFPILVKGYQELDNVITAQNGAIDGMQQQIDSLLSIVAACCQNIEPSFRMEDEGDSELQYTAEAKYILFQNDPNPFQYSTRIRYHIPAEINEAEILILDANGRVVKRIPLSLRDADGSVTVYSSDLNSGIYSYSLIGNGRVLETKKMVCSK